MVSFGVYDTDNFWIHLCGGAIISNRVIITAAHCFKYVDENMKIHVPFAQTRDKLTLKIKMGDEYLNKEEKSDVHLAIHEIGTVKTHPKYNQGQHFDIALVATNLTIEFNELTKPVCIPQLSEADKDHEQGNTATITGRNYINCAGFIIHDNVLYF